jgi:hypothetical protein
MKLNILFLIFVLFGANCLAQEIGQTFDKEQITQEVINQIERGEDKNNITYLPKIVQSSQRIQLQEDPTAEDLLDRFPFRPKPPADEEGEKEEPTFGDEDRTFFTGEIIKKIRSVIVEILDSLSSVITLSLYLFPIAVITYFLGFFLYGISSSIHGFSSVLNGIRKLKNKKE